MKKAILLGLAGGMLLLLWGCGAATAPDPAPVGPEEEGSTVEVISPLEDFHLESPSWQVVDLSPEDHATFQESMAQLKEISLEELTALCLWASPEEREKGEEELYRRFLEAPNTVLSYFVLVGRQTTDVPGLGTVDAMEYLCECIGAQDEARGVTKEFQQVLDAGQRTFPGGGWVQGLLTRMEMGRGTFSPAEKPQE